MNMRSTLKHVVLTVTFLIFTTLCAFPCGAQPVTAWTKDQVEAAAAQSFHELRQSIPLSRDVNLRLFVNCVVDSIVAELDTSHRSIPWEIEIFDHPAANAFALPGGKVGVFTGLLDIATTQDSLAVIIGHEISHVVSGHTLDHARTKLFYQYTLEDKVRALSSQAADALNLRCSERSRFKEFVDGTIEKAYERHQEVAADRQGLFLMAQAGFNPVAGLELWKNMPRLSSTTKPKFLAAHPPGNDRRERLARQLTEALILYKTARERGVAPACE